MAHTSYQRAKTLSIFRVGENSQQSNLNYVLEEYSKIIDKISHEHKTPRNVELALKSVLNRWKKGKKLSRASYMIPVIYMVAFDEHKSCDKNNLSDIENILISLDIVINNLDDSVDILQEDKKSKWNREVIKTINFIYIFLKLNKVIPDSKTRDLVINKTLDFIVMLTQIPWFEKKYSESISKSKSTKIEEKLAIECLRERAKDVDIFSELMILYLGIKKNHARGIIKAVRDYRALELFSKDYFDIDTDIEDESNTPTVSIYKKYKRRRKDFDKRILSVLDRLHDNLRDNKTDSSAVNFLKDLGKKKYDNLVKEVKK